MPGPDAPAVDAAAVARAVQALLAGGLVAVPTETVYGLAADADLAEAVAAIFDVKGRPRGHPLILHIATAAAAPAWARSIPPDAQRLMAAFWPGPLTLVLPRTPRASDLVTGEQDTVALRCPAGAWAQALLRALGAARGDPAVALAAPSANRYGRVSPTTAAHVIADLGEKPHGAVDVILDGGPSELGIESTIVDCTAPPVRILRPGAIDRARIAAVLGRSVALAAETAAAPRVSGRVAGHYAPGRALELVAPDKAVARAVALAPLRLGVLAPVAVLAALRASPAAARVLALDAAPEPGAYARSLYANLRQLDRSAVDCLLVCVPPEGTPWEGVNDRLRRAAAGSPGLRTGSAASCPAGTAPGSA